MEDMTSKGFDPDVEDIDNSDVNEYNEREILVAKRKGTYETFKVGKLADSIFAAAAEVGGEDLQIADDLATEIQDMLESNDIHIIEASDLHDMVYKCLVDNKHAATSERYLTESIKRSNQREMDTALMKSFEEITFKSEEDSEVKRENANIDSSTAMGTMLKYGSEAAKNFNLLYLMTPDVANAHRNGDIHIHDLDFLSLTETCITDDTMITLRENGEIHTVPAKYLNKFLGNTVDNVVELNNVEIMSHGKFVKAINCVKHASVGKRVLQIKCKSGELNVTDEHRVTVVKDGKAQDVKAKDLSVGDSLLNKERAHDLFSLNTIDLIDEFRGNANIIIVNSDIVISNLKSLGNWKEACSRMPYTDYHYANIRSGRNKITLADFELLSDLVTVEHSEMQLAYRRTRGSESINAVVKIDEHLGKFLGYMISEGSVTKHKNAKQTADEKKACFCNYDTDIIKDFNNSLTHVFNNPSYSDRKASGKVVGTRLAGYLTYELFSGPFGVKTSSANIRLPKWIFDANIEFFNAFIGALIDGDGTVQKDGYRIRYSSVCLDLLKQLQLLLLLHGIESDITELHSAEAGSVAAFDDTRCIRNYNNYILSITGNLNDKCKEFDSFKIGKTKLSTNCRSDNNKVKIESINEIEYTGFVYDLETEDHHFDANGFVVHNCMQIALDKLFDGGFNTGHGYLRQPGSIRAAAAQAAIAIQSDQNDQHGGQSIPLFDYYLAPYVALTYVKQIAHIAKIKFDLNKEKYHELKHRLVDYQKEHKTVMNEQGYNDINGILVKFCEEFKVKASNKRLKKVMKDAYDDTYYDTYQAMEAFIHNLNTMHSRAGAQVPFSSINYGTDTSTEGRMVMETILKSTWDGLGNGEIPIFPIQIFKLKAGVSYNKEDPNYDLFELACKVSAKRLYPNFVNLDAPYNAELYVPGHPETEMATMGCVESSEILHYTIDGLEYIETFGKAYNRISNLCKRTEYSYNSDYIDVSDIDVKVKDSVHGFVKVKKFIKNKNVNNFNVIKFSDGYSLTATSDHPLPVIGKGRTFVKDLSIGDKVEVSRKDEVNSDNKFKTVYFKGYTYLLGVILADASYRSQICISLGLDEKDVVDYIESIVNDLGYRLNVKEQHRGTKGDYFDCCIRGIKVLKYAERELASIFGGYKKADRIIPSSLLTASRKYRLAFLAGLMDADGHVTCSKSSDGETERSARFSIGSTNKALAMTELALIRGLGYKAKMYRNKYSSKHSKIRYLIEFEITDELVAEMHCGKKINKANTVDRCKFSDVDAVEVVSITSGCEENELDGISYDLETESDMLDISYISSHNCRTRVSTNKHDAGKQVIPGRGNLSFTSINLPRLAIMSNGDIDKFYKLLDNRLELVHKQLLQRFELQCLKHPINYPFLMGQGVWIGSDLLGPNDDIRDILKNGTLGVGFIGLAETLTSLIGEHHGQSERAEKLGLEIIQHMRDYTDAWSENEHMNYGVIGTPAEGLSGRFVRMDKKKFGVIPGVTDKEYYTNSSHIPVSFPISATKKIQLEAPFHAIENGGHILYIEMDGDPTKNVGAFMKVVRYMHDNNAGYFAINHPVDRDPVCNYTGIIDDVCPRCGRKEGEPMTMEMWKRIHQTAGAGNICTCGACGDPNEEADRISNAIDTSDLKFDFE